MALPGAQGAGGLARARPAVRDARGPRGDLLGQAHEELPYDSSFDAHATVLEVAPGQVATWPQNSGHRVRNTEGLNVSLSVEFSTAASLRRHWVWLGNRYLSSRLHLPVRSQREDGPWAASKALSYRVLRRVSPLPSRDHAPRFVVDPDAPLGVRDLVGTAAPR